MAAAAAAAVLCLATASCSQRAVGVETSGELRIAVATVAYDAYEQALFQGSLTWNEHGCLVTHAADESASHLVVFPKGTSLNDEEIELPNGYRFTAGEELGLGGGFHSRQDAKSDLAQVPEECLTEAIFWASGEVVE